MPTENRRVATYLPKELDERLSAFKSKHGLNGDSPALVAILSEFFKVSQQVARSASFDKPDFLERLEAVESKVAHLKDELLSELKSKLLELSDSTKQQSVQQVKEEVRSELLSELESKSPKEEVPGQLNLIPDAQDSELPSEPLSELEESFEKQHSEILSEPKSELQVEDSLSTLKPMSGVLLSRRFGIHDNSVNNKKNACKSNPEKFVEWSKSKDPDGIAWEYREDSKLYYQILESATSSNQVNPLPEGSERSEEG